MSKYVLVTGASTGIGQATAIALVENGYIPVLNARSVENLAKTQQKVGRGYMCIPCDLSNVESINMLIKEITAKCQSLHAIINVAGVWHGENEVYAGRDFDEFSQEIILQTLTVGITAPALLVHGLLPLMDKGSKIVNISGTFENGAKGWLPYYVSKRAIEDFTIGLAQELEEKDIQVNCISPSDTATEQYARFFPQYMEEAMDPFVVAQEIVELCEPNNTLSGKVIVMKKDQKSIGGFHA